MEDPITFNVWAVVSPEHKAEAQQHLQLTRPGLTRLQVLQVTLKSAATGKPLLLQENTGWADALQCAEQAAPAFSGIQIFQSDYGPEDQAHMHWCPAHAFYYGGILGCPVCEGFYVP